MITANRGTSWILIIALLGLGFDFGMWAGPTLPLGTSLSMLLFLVSLGVSLVATGAGLGGAVLSVPILLLLHRLGILAVGPTDVGGLASVGAVIATFKGSRIHRGQGTVLVGLARKMGVTGVLVALMMALWSYHWRAELLANLDLAVSLVAVVLLWTHPKDARTAKSLSRRSMGMLLGCTAFVGVVSGLTGMPGSFLLIPLMLLTTRLPYRNVVGTALQTTFYMASLSFLMKMHQGFISWPLAVPVILGSLAGSALGAQWGLATTSKTLRWLATVTIVMGATLDWLL